MLGHHSALTSISEVRWYSQADSCRDWAGGVSLRIEVEPSRVSSCSDFDRLQLRTPYLLVNGAKHLHIPCRDFSSSRAKQYHFEVLRSETNEASWRILGSCVFVSSTMYALDFLYPAIRFRRVSLAGNQKIGRRQNSCEAKMPNASLQNPTIQIDIFSKMKNNSTLQQP